jgi:hypothetical protein
LDGVCLVRIAPAQRVGDAEGAVERFFQLDEKRGRNQYSNLPPLSGRVLEVSFTRG